MRSVFITGGGGYCGTRLVHELLKKKYKVTVYDTFFYGNFLKDIKILDIYYLEWKKRFSSLY